MTRGGMMMSGILALTMWVALTAAAQDKPRLPDREIFTLVRQVAAPGSGDPQAACVELQRRGSAEVRASLHALTFVLIEQLSAEEMKDYEKFNPYVERLGACLAPIGPAAAVELANEITDPKRDIATQYYAVTVLGQMGPRAAAIAPILVEDLAASQERSPLNMASGGLRAIGEPAVPALIAGLKNNDAVIRRECAAALGFIKARPQEVGAALSAACKDPDKDARRAASNALASFGRAARAALPQVLALFDPADEDLHYEIVEILIASEARAELRRALESGSDAQIELVAQALSRMNPPAVAELRSGLGSPRARVKAAALAGLRTAHQMARDPGIPSRAGFATSEVAPLLGDADANVRVAAVDLLNAIGPPDNTLVPRLSALLRDNDARVRRAAAQAVGVFYPQAKAHASEIVRLSQDPDGAVRAAAYATLAVWPLTEERRAMLIAALDDASAEVRVAVLNAAGERSLGISTLPRISALLNDPRCAAYAAAAIGAMGPAAATAVPQVARLLHGGDSFSRAMACRGLIRLGPAGVTAVAAALPALTAMDKAMALEMLGKAGTAARAAMPAIKKLAADPDENVRSRAERALAAIAGDR